MTANGNYVTKQSAGIYSTVAPDKPFAPKDPKIYQATIDADKGPGVSLQAQGTASIETYTVMHDRKGPSFAILFGRLEDDTRFIANTPEDAGLLRDMVDKDYVGAAGKVVVTDDGCNKFRPA